MISLALPALALPAICPALAVMPDCRGARQGLWSARRRTWLEGACWADARPCRRCLPATMPAAAGPAALPGAWRPAKGHPPPHGVCVAGPPGGRERGRLPPGARRPRQRRRPVAAGNSRHTQMHCWQHVCCASITAATASPCCAHATIATATATAAATAAAAAAAFLQVPPSRWDVDQGWAAQATLPKRFGSFVEGAELFDHAFFAVSAQEVGFCLPCTAGSLAASLAAFCFWQQGTETARQRDSEAARQRGGRSAAAPAHASSDTHSALPCPANGLPVCVCRPQPWTPSSACCWRAAGRRWATARSARRASWTLSQQRRWASAWASATMSITSTPPTRA